MKCSVEIIKWLDITTYAGSNPFQGEPKPIYFFSVGIVLGKIRIESGGPVLRIVHLIPNAEDVFDQADYVDVPVQNIVNRKVLGGVTINKGKIVFDFNGEVKSKCMRKSGGAVG